MKRILLVLALMTMGCDDDLSNPSDHPVIETVGAEYESGLSTTFLGNVIFSETQGEIVRYGFIWVNYWDYSLTLKLENSNAKVGLIESDFRQGDFKLYVENIGTTHWRCFYRAFVETEDKIIYGAIKYFEVINE